MHTQMTYVFGDACRPKLATFGFSYTFEKLHPKVTWGGGGFGAGARWPALFVCQKEINKMNHVVEDARRPCTGPTQALHSHL